MKRILNLKKMYRFYFILILNTLAVYSQENNPGSINYNSAAELNSRIKLPKSPEAAAFEKYGSTPVNLYTGTPDISIPLHTYKGREIDVPMSINYDASGVKVSQIATNVGLGWNLNLGGRISRIANGIPDDLPNNPYVYSQEIRNYIDNFSNDIGLLDTFMLPVVNGQIDTQLDLYSLNVIGINDYVVRGLGSNQYQTLLNPRIKVTLNNNNWLVIGEDGTEYYFNNVRENTTVSGGSDAQGAGIMYTGNSTSSWLLTKIISKNKLDIFDFDYKLYTWANNYTMNVNSMSFTESLTCPIRLQASATWDMNRPYKISQQMPFTIKLNGDLLSQFNYKSRQDLGLVAGSYQGGNALDEIVFFNFKTSVTNSSYFKKIIFNHSYFGDSQSTDYKLKRLKLDSFTFYQSNLSNGKTYSFEYISPHLIPSITSNGQDFLGLNNGQTGNTNLVPGILYNNQLTVGAANRDSEFYYMKIGTLSKIIYPTKGNTEFEYEQNEMADNKYIPEYTYDVPVDVFKFRPTNFCDVNGYDAINQNMRFIPANRFGCYTGSNYIHYPTVRTTLMTINETRNYKLNQNGEGIFLIQKISGCENSPIQSYPCDDLNDQNQDFNPSQYLCLRPTNSLFITSPTDYSQPTDYIIGGQLCYSTSDDININLVAGTYQVTIWAGYYDPNNMPNPSIRIYKNIPTTFPAHYEYKTKKIEGFRIKSIKDYTRENILSNNKEYKYIENLTTNNSSAVQLGVRPNPKLYSNLSWACASNLSPQGICRNITTLISEGSNINTIPNVGYANVFEITKDNLGNVNGYSESKFNVGKTGLTYDDSGITSFEPVFKNGKLLEKNILNTQKNIKLSEKFVYDEQLFYSENSFSFNKNQVNTYAYRIGNGALQFTEGRCYAATGNMVPGPAAPPNWAELNPSWYSSELGKYSYHPVRQNIFGKYGYLSKKETITFSDSGRETKQTEDYVLGESYKLRRKEITGTQNIVKAEEYTYHPDYPENPEKITDIKVFSGNQLLTHRNNIYSNYGNANLVSEIKTAQGANTLESRLVFDYDTTSKNITNTISPTTTNPANDNYDSYIFGYNDMYPVAKLSGIKYNQISTARINAIKAKSNVVISAANDITLVTELNLLRSDFPTAQITTYTYDPVFGVTSETDTKGDVKYFVYDELGRLLNIKDKNGNILSENKYNYRISN